MEYDHHDEYVMGEVSFQGQTINFFLGLDLCLAIWLM